MMPRKKANSVPLVESRIVNLPSLRYWSRMLHANANANAMATVSRETSDKYIEMDGNRGG